MRTHDAGVVEPIGHWTVALARTVQVVFGSLSALLLVAAGGVLLAPGQGPGREAMELIGMLAGPAPESAYRITRTLGVASIAGGEFLFIYLVTDELCPNAPMVISGFLKTFFGLVFWLALLAALVLILVGRT